LTDINADTFVSSSHRPIGFPEFVLVIASIMALNPFEKRNFGNSEIKSLSRRPTHTNAE